MCVAGGGYSPCQLLDDFKQFYIGIFGNLFKGTELQEFRSSKISRHKLNWPKAYGVEGGRFEKTSITEGTIQDSVKWMLHVWITGCKSTQCSKSLS